MLTPSECKTGQTGYASKKKAEQLAAPTKGKVYECGWCGKYHIRRLT